MVALYLLGVVSAAAVALWSAGAVGLEKQRRRRRPRLSVVPPSDDAAQPTALDRALQAEVRRRARGGRPRRRAV